MNEFDLITNELLVLLNKWESKLLSLSEEIISTRRNKQSRTIKQIVGHMLDSASNNTHRIIHLQYDEIPSHFPDYANLGNNDRWIAIQNYQDENWEYLVQLWKFSNLHIIHVIKNIKPDKLANEWISALGKNISLKSMVIDYPRHFRLHLSEIEELLG
jgi:hypothetical protein